MAEQEGLYGSIISEALRYMPEEQKYQHVTTKVQAPVDKEMQVQVQVRAISGSNTPKQSSSDKTTTWVISPSKATAPIPTTALAPDREYFKCKPKVFDLQADKPRVVQTGFPLPSTDNNEVNKTFYARQRFPPPPNRIYALYSSSPGLESFLNPSTTPDPEVEHAYIFVPSLDGAAFVENWITMQNLEDERQTAIIVPSGPSAGTIAAQKIDFTRHLWTGNELASERRMEFIRLYDSLSDPLDICSVCHEKHIPPGPIITLADRDTCSSLLPDWYPRKFDAGNRDDTGNQGGRKASWDNWIEMWNELCVLQEFKWGDRRLEGFEGAKEWDLIYHEGREWREIVGRRIGWWRCRRKDEGRGGTQLDWSCELCHRKYKPKKSKDGQPLKELKDIVADRAAELLRWMDEKVQEQGLKDKEFVETRWKIEREEEKKQKERELGEKQLIEEEIDGVWI
jgi:hypothetical protein